MVGPGEDVVVYPVELVGWVVVDDCLARRSEHELPPIFQGELVGFVNKQDVTLAAPHLLRLVHRDELNEVAVQDVGGLTLIVQVYVVHLFPFEYLEKVAHDRGANGWEGLSCNCDDCPGVLVAVAQFDEGREDGVRLTGARAPLVDLYLGRGVLDVVICGRLPQLTVESSDTNHESGFFSATSISCLSTYPRALPLVFRKKMVAAGLPSLMSL